MSYILVVIFSVWFVDVVKIASGFSRWLCYRWKIGKTYYNDRIPYRLKPLDCTPCLSFWLALFIPHDDVYYRIGYAAAASMLAFVLSFFIRQAK